VKINHRISLKVFLCLFAVAFSLFMPFVSVSQEIPFLVNYGKSDYNADQQNWDVTQDDNHTMYFANTSGLLKYNGVKWKLFGLKDYKIIRSVLAVKDRIYIGAYGEFGYWQKSKKAELVYHSLSFLTKDKKFCSEEFWNIVSVGNNIYFQSFGAMYRYDGKSITQIRIPGTIMFAEKIRDTLYLPAIGGGIYKMVNGEFALMDFTKSLQKSIVSGLVEIGGNSILVATTEHGAFIMKDNKLTPFDASINTLLKKHQINKVLKYDQHIILFATISDGVYSYNMTTGELTHINKNKGLQNNTVLALFLDKNKGLWLGLDRGISYIDLNSDFKYFFDSQKNLGTIYTIAKINNTKYFGTNQGLYKYEALPHQESTEFKPISGISGQVWDLLTIGEDIICGHNTGTHLINKNGIKKISNINGGWHTIKIPLHNDLLIQATYTGLILLRKEDTWQFAFKVEGLNEAIERIVAINDHEFWLCGPIGNLKKITLSIDFKKITHLKNYTEINSGLPSIHKIQLVKKKDQIMVHSNDRQYVYDNLRDKFKLYSDDNFYIKNPNPNYLIYIYADSMVQVSPVKKMYAKKVRPDYNSILAFDNELLFLGDDNYFIKAIAGADTTSKEELPILKMEAVNLNGSKKMVEFSKMDWALDYDDNSFDIYFSNPYFKEKVLYSYTLDGPQNESSSWMKMEDLSFKNLKPGSYKLNLESSLGQSASLSFMVQQQWFLGKWMWFFYISCIVALIYYYKKKFEKDISFKMLKIDEENARQLREHKVALDNEQLKKDNLHKSKELANATMELIKKNEILVEIKDELIEIRKKDEAITQRDFQKMMRQINDNLTSEHDNPLFESNFSEVHEVFFRKLIANYPELTPQDLKLAAFLKMNLGTKEIAPLFNISVRGLENKRYRLRKKLNLENDVNLTEFFIKLG
jgi:DNA-binding CsgD family transcriptional regulator